MHAKFHASILFDCLKYLVLVLIIYYYSFYLFLYISTFVVFLPFVFVFFSFILLLRCNSFNFCFSSHLLSSFYCFDLPKLYFNQQKYFLQFQIIITQHDQRMISGNKDIWSFKPPSKRPLSTPLNVVYLGDSLDLKMLLLYSLTNQTILSKVILNRRCAVQFQCLNQSYLFEFTNTAYTIDITCFL